MKKYRRGAASFYVVVIATLVLAIVATSFAMVIIAQISRSANSELAQSAYDSAMAGIEDAKLAFSNYQKCIAQGTYPDELSDEPEVNCQDIAYYMNHPSCDMVGWILGRIPKGVESEVEISDVAGGSDLNQAYTCVKMDLVLNDYRSTVTNSNQVRVVKVALDGVPADAVERVRFSWQMNSEETESNYLNLVPNFDVAEFEPGYRVAFPSAGMMQVAVPPVVALQLIQTTNEFRLSDFEVADAVAGITDRATLYLVPSDNSEVATGSITGNYIGVGNLITANQIAKTNDRLASNLPMAVDCSGSESSEFACSVELELPKVVGSVDGENITAGERNDETFRLVVALPYGQPDTDFSLEFLCGGEVCVGASPGSDTAEGDTAEQNVARLSNVQVKIDATGRANDVYRRVEVRLESASQAGLSFPYYAVQLNGVDSEGYSLIKDLTVIGR